MEINKFFNELPIRILGTHEEPVFYASDIAKILEIKKVRNTIANFAPKEIVQRADRERLGIITYRTYHNQRPRRDDSVILLTSRGVYRLMLLCRTRQAEQFRDWMWDALEELRRESKSTLLLENERLTSVVQRQQEMINRLVAQCGLDEANRGYVYIISHPILMPHHVKIGKTINLDSLRPRYNTPLPKCTIYAWSVDDCNSAEKAAHNKLQQYRVYAKHEIFCCSVDTAIDECANMFGECYVTDMPSS